MQDYRSDWKGTVLSIQMWIGGLLLVGWLLSLFAARSVSAGNILLVALAAVLLFVGAVYVREKPKRKSTAWTMFGLGLFVLCSGAVLAPVFASARASSTKAMCLSNVKQLALVLSMYAADNDERLPVASNWRSATDAYIKNEFYCPESHAAGPYCFNEALSAVELGRFTNTSVLGAIFEVECANRDAHGGPDWIVQRHGGASCLGFLDGHANLVNQKTLPNVEWSPALE